MNDHDARTLTTRLFAAFFPGGGFLEDSYSIFLSRIRTFPADLGAAVIEKVIDSYDHMPRVGELRGELAEASLRLPSAADAWQQAMSPSLKSDERHPLVNDVIRSFGGTYSMRTDDEPAMLRTQFIKAYEDARRRAIVRFDPRELDYDRGVRTPNSGKATVSG